MNPFEWQWEQLNSLSTSGQVCTDGTYVYIETRDSGSSHFLAKYVAATMQRTHWQGYSQAAGNNYTGPLMTDGTYLVATSGNGIEVFLCSDMSYVGRVYPTNNFQPSGFIGLIGFFDGTYFWFGGLGFGGDEYNLNRLTPDTWAFSRLGSAGLGHTHLIRPCGNDIIAVSRNYFGIKKVNKAGGLIWSQLGFPAAVNTAEWDPVTDQIFACCENGELTVLRASDGAFVARNGTVGGTWAASSIRNGTDTDSHFTQGYGIGVAGGNVLISQGGSSPGTWLERRSTVAPFRSLGAFTSNVAGYPSPLRGAWNFCTVGTRVIGAMGDGSTAGGPTGPIWTDFDKAVPPPPNLTNVTPRAGKGLGLVFDATVGMTGPTLGAPVDGIGLPPGGVTQSDTTHIDIDIDVPPTHPLGAAEDITVEPPTGGGAIVI